MANFFLAFDQNLAIVPVLNKIDMTSADPDKVAEEMQQVLNTASIPNSKESHKHNPDCHTGMHGLLYMAMPNLVASAL